MQPVVLRTARLWLDQPTEADADDMAEYCADPLFERYMLTPWPYQHEHAESFIREKVPAGWEGDTEYNWAVRLAPNGPLMGMVGWRAEHSDVGYWMGAPFRRNGYTAEAARAIVDHVFAVQDVDVIRWECVVGNLASAAVARAAGFRFDGLGSAMLASRDGTHGETWQASLRRDDPRGPRGPHDGWPE